MIIKIIIMLINQSCLKNKLKNLIVIKKLKLKDLIINKKWKLKLKLLMIIKKKWILITIKENKLKFLIRIKNLLILLINNVFRK